MTVIVRMIEYGGSAPIEADVDENGLVHLRRRIFERDSDGQRICVGWGMDRPRALPPAIRADPGATRAARRHGELRGRWSIPLRPWSADATRDAQDAFGNYSSQYLHGRGLRL